MAIKINKKIIFSSIIILVLVGGGFFWWQPYYKQIQTEKALERLVNYIVNDTPEGKIIETKDGRLKFKIPEGWHIRKAKENMIGPIYILNPGLVKNYQEETDTNISKLIKESFESKSGCLIGIGHVEERKNLDDLKKEIEEESQYLTLLSEEIFEITEIDNYQALRYISDTAYNGYWITLFVPFENKTYTVSVVFNRDNKEECSQEFDKFLETVSIKP